MTQTPSPLRKTDYGFFGPDSPSWRVWAAPTALIGFQRSVVLEHFDPFLAAAVADSNGIYRDPRGRLDRTLAYFLTIAVADTRTGIQASEFLMSVHAEATGIEPISGKRYSANNPASQLWIHVTGWHSVLKCYEVYGPSPLSADEEQRYWQECAVAAELQTVKPADVPRSRAEVRAYFARVRPSLCTSERATAAMHYLLHTPVRQGGLRLWAGSRLIAPAAIATLPKWMRELGEFDQSPLIDRAVRPLVRTASNALGTSRPAQAVIDQFAPETGKILRRHLTAPLPDNRHTVTPAQARKLYGRNADTDTA